MNKILENISDLCCYVPLLVYCLILYDEMLQQLNDELDNCNYFGEENER